VGVIIGDVEDREVIMEEEEIEADVGEGVEEVGGEEGGVLESCWKGALHASFSELWMV
jgi:hypothetical protein